MQVELPSSFNSRSSTPPTALNTTYFTHSHFTGDARAVERGQLLLRHVRLGLLHLLQERVQPRRLQQARRQQQQRGPAQRQRREQQPAAAVQPQHGLLQPAAGRGAHAHLSAATTTATAGHVCAGVRDANTRPATGTAATATTARHAGRTNAGAESGAGALSGNHLLWQLYSYRIIPNVSHYTIYTLYYTTYTLFIVSDALVPAYAALPAAHASPAHAATARPTTTTEPAAANKPATISAAADVRHAARRAHAAYYHGRLPSTGVHATGVPLPAGLRTAAVPGCLPERTTGVHPAPPIQPSYAGLPIWYPAEHAEYAEYTKYAVYTERVSTIHAAGAHATNRHRQWNRQWYRKWHEWWYRQWYEQ